MDSDTTPPEVDPVERLVEDYLGRRRRGERPSPAEYAARYPEHGGRILELFPALELIEGLKPTPEDHTGLSGDPGAPIGPTGLRDSLEMLGDYAILRELGRGGMGIVYEAERESLKSRVALKVMHMRFRADRAYLRRFQTEARSAAKLHHTNIVPVFDYGEQGGIFYYAMQYIAGVGLERVLDDIRRLRDPSEGDPTAGGGTAHRATEAFGGPPSVVSLGLLTGRFDLAPTADLAATGPTPTAPLDPPSLGMTASAFAPGVPGQDRAGDVAEPVSHSFAGRPESVYFREVARLGAQVADALEHAHRQGVVHRDIKPSNLLLDARGNVWVTDFGLAKLVEEDDLSQSHELAGTMRFMPPERFRGVTDRRGDIYALGATLYELLTLRSAFAAPDQARLMDRIAHDPPTPLREHDPRIPRDLETLVLKALAKDPADRFASAGEMAEELRRFLESRPILSRPIPPHERLWRWCKRNPWLAGANVAAATLTTLLAIVATIAAVTFRAANRETRENLFESLTSQAQARRYSRRIGQRFESLDALSRAAAIARELKLPADRLDPLRDEAIACLALPDMKPVGRVIRRPRGAFVTAFDPAMTRYALRFSERVEVRRVADDGEIARFEARGDRNIGVFGFSPDGRYLVTAHWPGDSITVWDIERGSVSVTDPGPVVWGPAGFSPDGRQIAVVHHDGQLVIYDLATGQPAWHLRVPATVEGLAFRPDGALFAVVCNEPGNGTCRILDSESGRLVRSISLPTMSGVGAWSPDGTTLALTDGLKISLWDAATGIRKAVLEGPTNGGLGAAFHPSGALLASNGWESRLRLWDTVLGRPVLSLAGGPGQPVFSRDGRIVVEVEDRLTTYQVDPAIEYRTFAHVSSEPVGYRMSSMHREGRVLALAMNNGVTLWDVTRGAELAFLPIGNVWQLIFEASGDLITCGDLGVRRWPVRLDRKRGDFRIGPPTSLPFPADGKGMAEDRRGRIVAVAHLDHALVAMPERVIRVGALDDCRSVAVSPDGQWLATGSHARGAQAWRLDGLTRVANLPIEDRTPVVFSPDGKWLMTNSSPCKLWHVDTWSEGPQIGGFGHCFSPDGRQLVVQDASKALRLVEIESGRTLARFESPDSCDLARATFSPDGSRLIVTTNDGPAGHVHVWDLRAIRRHLASMGLDWDAPPYPDADPAAASLPPLPPFRVDLGPLAGHTEHFTEPAQALFERYTARIKEAPDDAEAYHHRGHALDGLRRPAEAIADFTRAIRLRPDDAHLRGSRVRSYATLKQHAPAIADFEASLSRSPDQPTIRESLAMSCNNRAWELVNGPGSTRDPAGAILLARRAVELVTDKGLCLNTLGVAEYRAGLYAEAVTTLERSRVANRGAYAGYDLFFLAMAHQRLGHGDNARENRDRALRWLEEHKGLTAENARELADFRAEAEAVLAGPADELPVDVFAPPR